MGAGASAEFRDNCAKLTDEEVQELEAKYSALKAKGIKGAGLIEQICVAAQDIKIKSAAEVEEDPAALALARARERVATLTRKVTSEAFSNFLVGTDGAKPSELALEVCLSELMKSKDSITVMHASDPTRDDLGPNMRPQAVRERVEVRLLSTMSKSRYKLMWIEKEKNQKIKTCILHQVYWISLFFFCSVVVHPFSSYLCTPLSSFRNVCFCLISGKFHDKFSK